MISYTDENSEIKSTAYDIRRLIEDECDEIKAMLLAKNEEHGNISRLRNMRGQTAKIKEDTVKDLIGYLILLRVSERR